jgi:DNA transposition AAA+ family ATPase
MDTQPHTTGPDTAQELEAVRARIRQVMADDGLTLTAIAGEAGVSLATLSAFQLGNYTGRNDRVAADLRRWLDSRAARAAFDRRHRSLDGFVETPTAGRIEHALAFAKGGEMVMVAGRPGVGKTTAVRQFQRRHPNVWICQVSPQMRSVPATLRAIGDAIGLHGLPRDGGMIMKAICQRVERAAGLLVLDEAQHLTDGALEQVQAIWELFRYGGGFGVAFVGHRELEGRIGALDHLASRVSAPVIIEGARPEDADALLDAAGIACPRSRDFLRSQAPGRGGLRRIAQACQHALFVAADEAGGEVTFDHVRRVWTHLSGRAAV